MIRSGDISLSLSLSLCLSLSSTSTEGKRNYKTNPVWSIPPLSLHLSLLLHIHTLSSAIPLRSSQQKGKRVSDSPGEQTYLLQAKKKKKKRTHFPKKPNSIKKGLQILLYRLSTLYSVLLLPTTSSIVLLLRVHIQEIDNSFFLFYSLFSFYILLPLGSIGGGLIPNSGLVWIVLYFFTSPSQLLFSLSPLLSFILLSSHHI